MTHETPGQADSRVINPTNIGKLLGATIVATTEYQAFTQAEHRYRNDTQAQELLQEYQDAQRAVQLMQHLGNDGAEETRKLEDLQKTLEANQTLMGYFDTQEKLIALLRELNESISERLNLDFAGVTKPKSGCCG